jgi:hypothetical protein
MTAPVFGNQGHRYSFMMNPYPDYHVRRCPVCTGKMGQRKVPLLIHVAPHSFLILGFSCAYCGPCNLLVANKHDIEHLLTESFRSSAPEVIGKPYLVFATIDRKFWREGMASPKELADTFTHADEFVTYYQELRLTKPGWYKSGTNPPQLEPPVSREWTQDNQELNVKTVADELPSCKSMKKSRI